MMPRIPMIAVMIGGLLFLIPSESAAQRKSRDVITRDEIVASARSSEDILQVIRALRPHFLAPARGIRTLGNGVRPPTALFVDGVRESDANVLRLMMASTVHEVRYLDPSRSEGEYGPSAAGGAVVVLRVKDGAGPARDTTKSPAA